MIDLLLVRHAPAKPRSSEADDADRNLSRQWRARLRRMVRGLCHLGVRFDTLYHSPWLRSIETANALAALLDGESTVTNRLCEAPSDALLAMIVGRRVAVVGHEPHLGSLAAWLVQGDADQRDAFALPPTGLVWLFGELSPGKMRLRALLPPGVLRVLAQRG